MLHCVMISLGSFGFLLNASVLAASTQTTDQSQNYIIFKIEVFKDNKCTDKFKDNPIVVDTSKTCSAYSYTDSKGVVTTGSQNNVHCYKDKVVFDKYPFSGKCLASESIYQGKQMVNKAYSVPVGSCQKAMSHQGPVYEKLVGYTYPGDENCTKLVTNKK